MSLKFFCCSLCVVIVLCCAAAFEAAAQIPRTLSYQGVLKQADGSPVSATTATFTVALYDALAGGTRVWGPETHANQPLDAGVYTLMLGKTVSFASLAFDKPYYLDVTVNGMSMGRHELTSVPYALKAAALDGVTVKNGNIGIGASDPLTKLHVAGQIQLDSYLKFNGSSTANKLIRGNSDLRGMAFYPNTSAWDSQAWIQMWGNDGSNRAGELELAGKYISFRYEAANPGYGVVGMTLAPDGRVGIGTNDPQYTLDVNGTIRGSSVIGSDARWKTDIAPLNDALAKVTQLRGVSFRWKDATRGAGTQIGVIAQEVEPVFPELVSTDSEGYKSVAYAQLVAPLLEAVKALKAENDDLKRRITALEAQIANQ